MSQSKTINETKTDDNDVKNVDMDLMERGSTEEVAAFLDDEDGPMPRALADAGRWAYGTVCVELWVWNDTKTMLFRPPGAVWTDPVVHDATECRKNPTQACPMCRLTNTAHPDYIPVTPVPAGVGLPGILWSEQAGSRHEQQSVTWRNVPSLANDPDLPYHPRLQPVFATSPSTKNNTVGSNLGWAAAVAVHRHDHSGLVIFMARDGVDQNRLQSQTNEEYLLAASDMIAATYFLRVPLLRVMNERRFELAATLRRAKNRILALRRLGINLEKLAHDNADAAAAAANSASFSNFKPHHLCLGNNNGLSILRKRVVATALKSRGGNVQPPPAMGWEQTILTFFACLITLSIITRLNVLVNSELGGAYTMVLPLFGSLMTCLYGLSSAPASQPRNIILGQGLCMVIGLAFGYADGMTPWMRQTISTSLAVAAMVKCGVTHPPGASAALLFSAGKHTWFNFLFIMIGNVIAILCATAINNASEARQFPSYWGFSIFFSPNNVFRDRFTKPLKNA